MAKAKPLTDKQEAFARYVVEGETYSTAYRRAYNAKDMLQKTVNEEACRVAADRKVSARVMELQEAAAERTLVTVQSLTEEYEEARLLALQEGQAAAASTATTGKGKLHGLFEKDNAQQGITVNLNGHTANF